MILLITLLLLTILFGIAFAVTGALLKACLWLAVLFPLGLVLWVLGLVCCCTLVLIPVGILLFKAGGRVMLFA